MDCNNLLSYKDFNKQWYIHTDASNFQLRAVTSQLMKPITFYSIQPTRPQKCVVTENELLSIVETLSEFKNILLGEMKKQT